MFNTDENYVDEDNDEPEKVVDYEMCPEGVACTESGKVVVSDSSNNRILIF